MYTRLHELASVTNTLDSNILDPVRHAGQHFAQVGCRHVVADNLFQQDIEHLGQPRGQLDAVPDSGHVRLPHAGLVRAMHQQLEAALHSFARQGLDGAIPGCFGLLILRPCLAQAPQVRTWPCLLAFEAGPRAVFSKQGSFSGKVPVVGVLEVVALRHG